MFSSPYPSYCLFPTQLSHPICSKSQNSSIIQLKQLTDVSFKHSNSFPMSLLVTYAVVACKNVLTLFFTSIVIHKMGKHITAT
jgi:hypothetical protein